MITTAEFGSLVQRYLDALEGGQELTDADYEAMVRLWNTLSWRRPHGDAQLFDAFQQRFFPQEVRAVTQRLQMTPSKGMALYSRERDLWLGGAPHEGSMYRVEG